MSKHRFSISVVFVVLALCGLSCRSTSSSIERALLYLQRQQVIAPGNRVSDNCIVVDYTGNWPQYARPELLPAARVRDVSPFVPAFVHHALSLVAEDTVMSLGLDDEDAQVAREMRQRSVDFMRRFEAPSDRPEAGTYGFWPFKAETPFSSPGIEDFLINLAMGFTLGGARTPANLPFYPSELGLPSDADSTAVVYAALLDNSLLDGGQPVSQEVARFFSDWRDENALLFRKRPLWLPERSGVYLTWLHYQSPPDPSLPNDVDLLVNANVLFALGRYDALDTPGVEEAVFQINRVVSLGLHQSYADEVAVYYPDNFAFQYCVSRAYFEGHVDGLRPAVEIMANQVEATAIHRPDGTVCWDIGSPHLNTAFAVLTLLNAGRSSELVDKSVAYLVAEQNPMYGNWDEGVFFVQPDTFGQDVEWVSSSFTTAMAMEALCRYELSRR